VDVSSFFDYPTLDREEHSTPFLADASEAEWEKVLAHTELRRLRAGETLFKAGETERALYLTTEGRLELLLPRRARGGEIRFLTLDAPTVVGQLAFLDGEAHSGTVRALTDCEALRLSYESFESLSAREPRLARAVLFDLSRVLASRLRHAHEVIAEAAQ
jgi:CRP-like cAMP-binding protein